MNIRNIYGIMALLALMACDRQRNVETTPWGSVVSSDSVMLNGNSFTLDDIQANGELIVLTMTGPDNYYDYHGRGLGTQYLLAEKFAQSLGVSLRVELCRDTAEMVSRLQAGDGDIIACLLPKGMKGMTAAGVCNEAKSCSWYVDEGNGELATALNKWFDRKLVAKVRKEEDMLFSKKAVIRRVYSPMLNRAGGVISHYDRYFQQYAPLARWDWRLVAAQCYQESTFDPQARSWAGACGLMQIMPKTAEYLGLPMGDIFNPEKNIEAACRYLAELNGKLSDVRDRQERVNFVLASYNGGILHIRDAMALAEKNGKNKHRWAEVSQYVLGLAKPQYYNDPVVKYGYMRGSETVDYVQRINARYDEYRGVARGTGGFTPFGGGSQSPRKSERKNRFEV
ncbi:MAG: transglycosylase SLT domain-containing protein [Prevotella sp.]|nr:transglycosylase SLT domain-containing protein [Prevotella sp.]